MKPDSQSAPPPEPLQWTVRLYERDPQKLLGIWLACMVAGLLGWVLLHSFFGVLLGMVLIAGATTDFWLPQKFTLDEHGAHLRCGISLTSLEWDQVRRIVEDAQGVKLSPLPKDSKLEPFRGVYLRYSENRDQVLEKIREFRGDDASVLG